MISKSFTKKKVAELKVVSSFAQGKCQVYLCACLCEFFKYYLALIRLPLTKMTSGLKRVLARKPLIEDNVALPTQANKKMAVMTTLLVIRFYKVTLP